MAETTEVIQEELDETRHNLADKLAQLGDKISGTVENVEETVENVTEAASETVETVKETVSQTVETVKDTFNLQKQADEHPWLVFGGAVALGYIGGKLLSGGGGHPYHRGSAAWPTRQQTYSMAPTTGGAFYQQDQESQTGRQAPSEPTRSESGGWLSGITQKFGSELDTLKGLALGAVFGLVRDMVSRNLPQSLKGEVSHVLDNITENVGGKPIQGSVLGEDEGDSSDDESDQGSSEHGDFRRQHNGRSQEAAGQEESQRTKGQKKKSRGAAGR